MWMVISTFSSETDWLLPYRDFHGNRLRMIPRYTCKGHHSFIFCILFWESKIILLLKLRKIRNSVLTKDTEKTFDFRTVQTQKPKWKEKKKSQLVHTYERFKYTTKDFYPELLNATFKNLYTCRFFNLFPPSSFLIIWIL